MSEDDPNLDNFKIIYLLGAGFSLPAGLPDIKKISEDFFNHNTDEKTKNLKIVMEKHYKKKDVESFLTLIKRLEDLSVK